MSATQTAVDLAIDSMLDAVDGITIADLRAASCRLYAVACATDHADREEVVARLLTEIAVAETAVHARAAKETPNA